MQHGEGRLMALAVIDKPHSRLGASSAHRWMACPGSVRLTADLPNKTSEHAALGTAAHEIGERALRTGRDVESYRGETIFVDNPGKTPFRFEVDDDMIDAVSVYVDLVREEAGDNPVNVEVGFALRQDERFFGTNDASVYLPEQRTLVVYDYKHGAGYMVDADDNPQLKYYALGAIMVCPHPVSEIELVIVQPRGQGEAIKRWSTTPFDLMDFGAELVAGAARVDDPNAPLATGAHCQFCDAAPVCPARREEAYSTAGAMFDAEDNMTLPDPKDAAAFDLSQVLLRAERIRDWVSQVERYARERAEQGNPPTGFKLVEGRKLRAWNAGIDEADIVATLSAYAPEKSLYTSKLVSPAQAEKLIGKEAYKAIEADVVHWKSGTTALVPVSDRRPEISGKRDASALFA